MNLPLLLYDVFIVFKPIVDFLTEDVMKKMLYLNSSLKLLKAQDPFVFKCIVVENQSNETLRPKYQYCFLWSTAIKTFAFLTEKNGSFMNNFCACTFPLCYSPSLQKMNCQITTTAQVYLLWMIIHAHFPLCENNQCSCQKSCSLFFPITHYFV